MNQNERRKYIWYIVIFDNINMFKLSNLMINENQISLSSIEYVSNNDKICCVKN